MKTEIIFAVRCNPTRTIQRLGALEGTGTAYVTELLRSSKSYEWFVNMKDWKEVSSFDEMRAAAKVGKDVLYRTASLQGRSRMFVQA